MSAAGIVWIASYPKSGNTWVRAFLANLNAVMSKGLDATAQDINAMQKIAAWDIDAKRFERELEKNIADCSEEDIARARVNVQEKAANMSNGLQLLKTHNMLSLDHGFPTVNMSVTSGGIYIIRNPFDVAVSFSHHLNRSLDETIKVMSTPSFRTKTTSTSISEIYGSWEENVSSWTHQNNPALLVVKYEDMSSDPEKTFSQIAAHLRQPANANQIQRAIELSSFESLNKMEKENGFDEKPEHMPHFFRSGKIGEGKNLPSEKQQAMIEIINGEQMRRFDYL